MPWDENEMAVDFQRTNREIEILFRDYFFSPQPSMMVSDNGWSPNTDIFETETELVIRMELAGTKRDHIHISLKDNILTIRGKRKDVWPNGRVYYHQMEISYGIFERVIVLPESLKNVEMKASYQDGFLEIVIPKQRTSPAKPINIEIED